MDYLQGIKKLYLYKILYFCIYTSNNNLQRLNALKSKKKCNNKINIFILNYYIY